MENQKKMLSIIIPAYNEQDIIATTAIVVSKLMVKENIPYEILFIDDGSKDLTWEKIEEQALQNEHIKGIGFSKNFGKESAIFAGLEKSEGSCCVVMDCDLQHPPEKIIEMYHLWEQGYEIVEGVKADRGKESALHTVFANFFYGLMSKATGFNMRQASDFKLMDRKVVSALLNMKEKNAFFRALSSWVGFKTISIDFKVQERTVGSSKWSTWALVQQKMKIYLLMHILPMPKLTI